jgi:hypothetical protein
LKNRETSPSAHRYPRETGRTRPGRIIQPGDSTMSDVIDPANDNAELNLSAAIRRAGRSGAHDAHAGQTK